jgi:two-component system, chemotaxis family, sensor kinase CheA
VDVALLDQVMNLVGELVLARNQVLQFASRTKDTAFLAASQRLNLITTELQEGVMKTRMQPIGNIWGQFPRTVRDVALGCGKEVGIEMEGKETELDKTIIEAIKDPFTHLVRNSVDHGIELPEDNVKAGKDRTGRLILRAFHEGGQVNSHSCGGLPPRMTTSTKLGPTTFSILLAKRLAFPSALNSPVNPNTHEQSKAT